MYVSTQPEGPGTGQIDQGFPWPSSALEQVPSFATKFHVALHTSQAVTAT